MISTKSNHCTTRLDVDHRLTETVLSHLQGLIENAEWQKAREEYELLKFALTKHFALEEKALFSQLNGYQTMILMELEHDHLLELMNTLSVCLEGDDEGSVNAEQVTRTFKTLQERLHAHILEEDRGVFPLTETVLTEVERQTVYDELETLVHTQDMDWISILTRPEPQYAVDTVPMFDTAVQPIALTTLFESGHDSVKLYQLAAGQSLAPHWAGEDTCLLVLSGTGILKLTETTYDLAPGSRVRMSPRLRHAVEASTDLAFLQIRIWPWPHFSKMPGKSPL